MFNVGFIRHLDKNEPHHLAQKLASEQCIIHYLNLEEVSSQLTDLDALILETSTEDVGKICEVLFMSRRNSNMLIWIVSNQMSKINRTLFLQLGADGIFDQQIDAEEFSLTFIGNLTRRINNCERKSNESKIELNADSFSVTLEGKNEVSLTKLEFIALDSLSKHKGETVSYEKLYENIWGNANGNKKYRIANLIFHLRKKMNDTSGDAKYIKTIRSRGYKLID